MLLKLNQNRLTKGSRSSGMGGQDENGMGVTMLRNIQVGYNVSAAEPVLMGVDACYGSVALLVVCFIYILSTFYIINSL